MLCIKHPRFYDTFRFLWKCRPTALKDRFVRCRSVKGAPQSMFYWCLTCVATEDHPTAIYAPAPDCCLSLYIQLLLTLWLITLTSTYVPPFWFLKHNPTTLTQIVVSGKVVKQESKPENSKQLLHITLHLAFSLRGIPYRTSIIKLYFSSLYLGSVWYSHLTKTVK